MAGEASQVRRGDAGAAAQLVRGPDAAHTAQPCDGGVTLWVMRTDVAGARYAAVKGVDAQQSVDDFTARWVSDKNLDVDPSLVTLKLVKCGSDVPTKSEEAAALAATPLMPRLTLRAAGIADGSSLLAVFAGALLVCAPHVCRL
jgi:hypothetical protein